MHLEGTWPVHREDREIGQCRFVQQGLYWVIDAQCASQGSSVCRLVLRTEGGSFNLGIPVPEGGQLCLRRKMSAKGLPVSPPFRLELIPLEVPGVQPPGSVPHWREVADSAPAEVQPKPPEVPSSMKPDTPSKQDEPKEESGIPENPTAATASPEPEERIPPENSADSYSATAVPAPEERPAVTRSPESVIPDSGEAPPAPAVEEKTASAREPTSVEEIASSHEPSAVEEATSAPEDGPTSPPPVETSPAPSSADLAETSARGIPYDPQKPLPPLGNWERLRAVANGRGGLLICTAEDDVTP